MDPGDDRERKDEEDKEADHVDTEKENILAFIQTSHIYHISIISEIIRLGRYSHITNYGIKRHVHIMSMLNRK